MKEHQASAIDALRLALKSSSASSTAAIGCEMQLSSFVELDYDISNFYSDLKHSPVKPSLGFVMVMNSVDSLCQLTSNSVHSG